MIDEPGHLHRRSAEQLDPTGLREELRAQRRGPVLGGIANWASPTENDWPRPDLSRLPDPCAAELAGMAPGQGGVGTTSLCWRWPS
ncbi:MAG: hypothetical protein AB7G47_13950 [Mycolicibacterium sp.]|uniref:hypothetical protein n=1 Tax=Mycolicibacterium sp. TaxID=2320850 RepID=UPI003D13B082